MKLGPSTSLSPSEPEGEQVLELTAGVSAERVAHELGHVLGLPDLWRRPDRDRHLRLSESAFCGGADSHWDASICRLGEPASWSHPYRATTGLFGPFDANSAMNLAGPEVCEAVEPDRGRMVPTNLDRSAAIELYQTADGWSPFRPVGKDVAPDKPIDHSLAPGVSLVGSPALLSTGTPNLDVYAAGSDGQIYYKANIWDAGLEGTWYDWAPLGCCFARDPSATSWDYSRRDVVARSVAGDIRWRFLQGPQWSEWYTLGAPSVGTASAPVITTNARHRLELFVRGGDGLLYQKSYAGSWKAGWRQLGDDPFIGKPGVALRKDGTVETVVATSDGGLRHETFIDGYLSASQTLDGPIAPDTSPSLVVTADELHLFVSTPSHHLAERVLTVTGWSPWRDLGGILAGSPGALGNLARREINVAAGIEEGGNLGVWVRSWPISRPCYVELMCGVCSEPSVSAPPAAPSGAPTHHRRLDGSDALQVRAADGHLYYFVRSNSAWSGLDLYARAGGPAGLTAGETSAYSQLNGTEIVIYRAIDNQVGALSSTGTDEWLSWRLSDAADAPDAKGTPFGIVRADGYETVVYRGIDDHVYQLWLDGSGWHFWDFTSFQQTPSAASDPYAFIRSDEVDAIFYTASDGRIHELYLLPSGWQLSSMVPLSGNEPLGNVTTYVRADQRNAIVYRSADGEIHEWSADWNGHNWAHDDVSMGLNAPAADADPVAYVGADGKDAIVYRSNRRIYQLRRDPGGWVVMDLSAHTKAPDASSSPTPFVRADGASTVAYVTVDGRLVELWSENGEIWNWSVIFDRSWQ